MSSGIEIFEDMEPDVIYACEKILSRLAGDKLKEIKREWVDVTEMEVPHRHIAFVGLRGDFQGSCFMLVMKEEAEELIIDVMGATGMPVSKEEKIQVSLEELTNMIAGFVFSELNDWYDYDVEFTTPVYRRDYEVVDSGDVEKALKVNCNFTQGGLNLYFLIVPENS